MASAGGEAMTERLREVSPQFLARMAGLLYFVSVLTAVVAEFVLRGRLGFFVAVVLPVSCYLAVTVLLYAVFRMVNRPLAWAAVVFNVAGLACEALQLRARGANLGMASHGVYCVLLGFLMLRSMLLPRIFGAMMAFAGMVWLVYLLPGLAGPLGPYNTIAGLLGEGIPMLWLMLVGVHREAQREPAGAAASS
jgi:Domain of unknown function (DUF4386)